MRFLTLIIIMLLIFTEAFNQINTDSIFDISIKYSKVKEYEKSIAEAEKVLAYHPERTDVMIHIANVYSWQGKFDNAKTYIFKVHVLNPKSKDLYNSWLNILLWNGEYEEIHKITEIAIANNYTDLHNIAYKKLIAYKNTAKYKRGINYAETLPNEIINSPQIKAIYNDIYNLSKQKQFSFFYSINFFDKNTQSSQHLAYADYSYKINKNTLVLRANYGNRFEKQDYQIEADYYQILKNSQYLYLNYGVGIKHELFPQHRVGFEYYFPITKSVNASAGNRLLIFDNSNVLIFTSSIGKYIGNSSISFRPFFTYQSNGNSFALVANYRYYLKNPANFWGIEATYGNSPDDRYVISNTGDIFKLNNYKIKARRNILLSLKSEMNFSLGYSNEDFFENEYRNRYSLELLFKYRF